jgi:hypothetical protein
MQREASVIVCSRRGLLARAVLAVFALVSFFPGLRMRRPADPTLVDADRRIARLGERLAELDPAGARELARWAEGLLGGNVAQRPRRVWAARARRTLADPARLGRDLASGQTVICDGWVLARSEAALAVALHQASAREPLRA